MITKTVARSACPLLATDLPNRVRIFRRQCASSYGDVGTETKRPSAKR